MSFKLKRQDVKKAVADLTAKGFGDISDLEIIAALAQSFVDCGRADERIFSRREVVATADGKKVYAEFHMSPKQLLWALEHGLEVREAGL